MNKYGNHKLVLDGHKFDSKREAQRYWELKTLALAGEVTGLTLQVPFVLAPAVKFEGDTRTTPAVRYYADFVYTDVKLGRIVVEDVKSKVTAAEATFRLKRHLMKTVHNIDLKVTT